MTGHGQASSNPRARIPDLPSDSGKASAAVTAWRAVRSRNGFSVREIDGVVASSGGVVEGKRWLAAVGDGEWTR